MSEKRPGFCVVIFISLTCAFISQISQAQAESPIFVVVGKLADPDDVRDASDLVVAVTNETRSIKREIELKTERPAETYAVPLVALDENPVVAAGDRLTVEVQTFDGTMLGSAAHTVSEAEVNRAKAVIDIQLQAPATPQEPTPSGEPGTTDETENPIFVVVGNVTDEKGTKAADGLTVTVTNETKSLTQETQIGANTAAGSYVVSFVALDEKPIVTAGDVLRVTVQVADSTRGNVSHPVTEAESDGAKAEIDVQLSAVGLGPLTGIEFAAEPPAQMTAGDTFSFGLLGSDAAGKTEGVSSDDVRWEVTGGIGTIDETGLLSAKTVGSRVVKATLKANAEITTQSREIIVVSAPAATIEVSPSPSSLTAGSGETAEITITVTDAFGNRVTNETITLTISPLNGDITRTPAHQGNGVYTATYTAGMQAENISIEAEASNGTKGNGDLTLTEVMLGPLAQISFADPPPAQMIAGGRAVLSLTGSDDAGQTVAVFRNQVIWGFSGDVLGTVDASSGLFTAKFVGTGKITATLKSNATIRVESSEIAVIAASASDVQVASSALNLIAGSDETAELTITVTDEFLNPVTNERISLTISPANGSITRTATHQGDGVYTGVYTAGAQSEDIFIEAQTSNGVTGNITLTLLAIPLNITQPSVNQVFEVAENQPLTINVGATGGTPPFVYSGTDLPGGATLDTETGEFSWTPAFNQGTEPARSYSLTFTVTDGANQTASVSVTINVTDVNRPPEWTQPPTDQTVDENGQLRFTVAATDADGDNLTYSTSDLPPGAAFDAAFDPTARAFSWRPTFDQGGQSSLAESQTYPVTFIVTAAKTAGELRTQITITVNNVNRKPQFAPISAQSIVSEKDFTLRVSASDPDGDAVIYAVADNPDNADFDETTGQFSWTPMQEQGGQTYPVIFTATDAGGLSETQTVQIEVRSVVPPLGITFPTANQVFEVDENKPLTITLRATGGTPSFTYSMTNPPSDANLKPDAGQFSWTPTHNQGGEPQRTYSLTFTVRDAANQTDSVSISIRVKDVNRPSVLADINISTWTKLLPYFSTTYSLSF